MVFSHFVNLISPWPKIQSSRQSNFDIELSHSGVYVKIAQNARTLKALTQTNKPQSRQKYVDWRSINTSVHPLQLTYFRLLSGPEFLSPEKINLKINAASLISNLTVVNWEFLARGKIRLTYRQKRTFLLSGSFRTFLTFPPYFEQTLMKNTKYWDFSLFLCVGQSSLKFEKRNITPKLL